MTVVDHKAILDNIEDIELFLSEIQEKIVEITDTIEYIKKIEPVKKEE